MHKFLACLLLVVLLLPSALAESENWYLDHALSAVSVLNVLIHDETYHKMMTTQTFDTLETLKQSDYAAPTAAYRYTSFDDKTIKSILSLLGGGELSEAALEICAAKFPQTLLALNANQFGAEVIAVGSMMTYVCTERMPEDFEPCFVLLSFGDTAASVTFCRTGTDSITIQAQPFFFDEEKTADEAVKGFTPQDLPVFPIKSEKLL